MEGLESRLAELGASCVLLVVSPEFIVERLAFRVRASGRVADAKEVQEEADRWMSEQDIMIREAAKSSVPTTLLNTDAME